MARALTKPIWTADSWYNASVAIFIGKLPLRETMLKLYLFILSAGALVACGELHDDVYWNLFGPDPGEPVFMENHETGDISVCGAYRDPKMPDWEESKLISLCVERHKGWGYVKTSRPSDPDFELPPRVPRGVDDLSGF
jgi:hypothetical protein